ncbi:MAG: hypothetical protein BWY74_03772 [Firmicutes bacterium ADurb.Bin419]|nr:MAG: hypothetical protein BWY74_03772 [Firmicutes bacterium ADurb.Bin419]
MAKVDVKMPEDFLMRLSRLGENTDTIIPKVLEEGAKIVEEKVKTNLRSAIGRNLKSESRSTGKLVASLGVSSVKLDKDGNFNVKVGFSEPHDSEVSNAMLASVLEYGKSGQTPRPFMKPAKTSSKIPCIEAMKRKFEEEVEKL